MSDGQGQVAVLLGAALVGLALAVMVDVLVVLVSHRRGRATLRRLRRFCRWPFLVCMATLAVLIAWPAAGVDEVGITGVIHHVLVIVTVVAVAWLVAAMLFVLEDLAFLKLRTDEVDDKRYRRARTQVGMIRRITVALVALVALAAVLLSFPSLRTFGTSLLATAGIAGIVAAFSAQGLLANVFAGLQLAFTDALRIGDVVVVEEEWGRVEQLTLTYVVIQVWDERRLVLPTSYFATHPFQNWTRDESRVIGDVRLHVDPTAPFDRLREHARGIVESSPLWDRRDWVLQVVDQTPDSAVVRILASAADGPSAFDLKCLIREEMLVFIADECPEALPRHRTDLDTPRP